MNRLKLFKKGSKGAGKVIPIPSTYESLLSIAVKHFDCDIETICLEDESLITDIDLLRDNDTIYAIEKLSIGDVSENEDNQKNTDKQVSYTSGNWITLNVGGRCFTTTRSTLTKYPDSMLHRMFNLDENWENTMDKHGNYLVDRSPDYFEPILNYLRNGILIINDGINPKGVLEEAKFFGIKPIVEELESTVHLKENEESCVSRFEFMRLLMTTSSKEPLRCQGVNLSGADLSYLDLRYINFKYANLSHANLSGASLDGCQFCLANLSYAILDDATLDGVQMKRTNLENASLKNCKFEAQSSTASREITNLEGANLKGANLEGSQMSSVNLRLGILKNTNMQNCVLRDAILAGADLENCNLTGADLQGANLRGANVVGTVFLNIVAPLHMVHLM